MNYEGLEVDRDTTEEIVYRVLEAVVQLNNEQADDTESPEEWGDGWVATDWERADDWDPSTDPADLGPDPEEET